MAWTLGSEQLPSNKMAGCLRGKAARILARRATQIGSEAGTAGRVLVCERGKAIPGPGKRRPAEAQTDLLRPRQQHPATASYTSHRLRDQTVNLLLGIVSVGEHAKNYGTKPKPRFLKRDMPATVSLLALSSV